MYMIIYIKTKAIIEALIKSPLISWNNSFSPPYVIVTSLVSLASTIDFTSFSNCVTLESLA